MTTAEPRVQPPSRLPASSERAPALETARPRAWTVLVDVTVPGLLSVLAVHDLLYNGAGPAAWLLAALTVWPLVLRRRRPQAVFVLCLAGLLGLTLTDSPPLAGFALLPALFTVAATGSIRRAVIAALALEVVVFLVAPQAAPARSIDDTVVILSALAVAALFLGTTVRSQRGYLAALEDRAARLEREQQQAAQLAATAERTRIAREMHDIVAHGLAVMITLAEGAATRAEADPATARSTMEQVAATGRQSLGEMRRLLSVLRSDDPAERDPQPRLSDLPALLDDVRTTGLRVDSDVDGALEGADPVLQATLYRAVQEALTNVMKHADGATAVRVRLRRQTEDGQPVVAFLVADDGRRASSSSPGGDGLRGMAERVGMFGGSLDSGFGQDGWTVRGTLAEGQATRGLRARRR